MRVAAWVALGCLLAGCAAPADDGVDVPQPVAYVTPPPLVVADGTYKFPPDPAPNALGLFEAVYFPVTQIAVSPCSYGTSAYFSNRQVPTAGGFDQRARNGNLTVTMTWGATDFLGAYMVVGYSAPGMENLTDSPRIGNGQTVTFPVQVRLDAQPDSWRMWACINRSDDADQQLGPFLGSFAIHAVFQADAELPVDESPEDDRRTSRGRP